MDENFIEIFSRPPDEIIGGDYIYHSPCPWREAAQALWLEDKGITLEILHEQREKRWCKDEFKFWRECWEERTFQGDYPFKKAYEPWMISLYEEIDNGFSKINEIFGKIAAEGKPVMDISSSDSFGFIPFIAKMNPQRPIPCMATDIDSHLIKCLRQFIDRDLTEYNIGLASFDNFDMPIKDNSLDCITSTFGISLGTDAPDCTVYGIIGEKNPITEIYRILKPGGCFITVEPNKEWKFDLAKTHEACSRHGKLFERYTYDEIEAFQNKLSPSWRDQFVAAGFQVGIEEKYPEKVSGKQLTQKLYQLISHLTMFYGQFPTDPHKISELSNDEEQKFYSSITKTDFPQAAEDFGIEFTKGYIFYVLQK